MPPGYEFLYEDDAALAPVDGGGLGIGGTLGSAALLGGGYFARKPLLNVVRPLVSRVPAALASRLGAQAATSAATSAAPLASQASSMLSGIAGTPSAQASAMLSEVAAGGGTAAETAAASGARARAAALAGRLRPLAGRVAPAARNAATAARAIPVGSAAALSGAALAGGLIGTEAGEAIYDTAAGRAAAEAANRVGLIGGSGEDVLTGQEGRGILGTVGRGFSYLPFGPDSDLPQTIQQETGVYAPADANQDGFTSQVEFDAAMAAGLPAQIAASRPQPEAVDDDLGRVLQMLEDRAVGVEQDYQSRVNELRGLYQTSETAEERAQLQYALGTLEAQRQAGHTVIQNAYGQAMADSAARSQSIRDAAGRQSAEMQQVYAGAAGDVGGIVDTAQGQYADSGLGVGATAVSGNVTDFVPLLEGEGARSAALAQNLGNISADDVAFLGSALAGEQGAQQGALEREALRLTADATMAHNQRVQDRTSQERMLLAGQIGDQQRFYDQRRYAIDDTGLQLALDMMAQGQQTSTPQQGYMEGLAMLNDYGAAALPYIAQYGLIPPDDLRMILESMGG